MANTITFVENQFGLGAPLPGQDFISGYAHYYATASANLPIGFSQSQVQEVFSINDLQNLGITQSQNEYGIIWYHVNEYFRMQPQGALYVGIFATGSANSYNDLQTLQNASQGTIRQIGVYESVPFSTGNVTLLQTMANTLSFTNYMPAEIFYQPNFKGLTLSTLTDLSALTANNVSVLVGQDGAGLGAQLYTSLGKTIGCVGTFLGSVALAAVEESVAWPYKFNVDSGTEFDTLAFATGDLYSNLSVGLINQLDSRRYVYPKKLVGLNGSFWNNPYTAVSPTNDLCFVFRNRVIHKAERNLRTVMTPELARNIYFNADGTINFGTIKYWETLCEQQLASMVQNGELSAYNVFINPTQKTESTNVLTINVELLPVGVANNIIINIGFTTSV
jgi:hypothetical protein